MTTSPKKEADKKKTLILGGIIAILALGFGYQTLSERGMSIMTDDDDFKTALRTLTQKQDTLQTLLNDYSEIQHKKELFTRQKEDFWVTEKHGDVKSTAHRLVEQAAKAAGVELTALGNLTEQKVDDDMSMWSFSISTDASMVKIAQFMHELHSLKPAFNWGRCSIRPKSSKEPDVLHLQGTLSLTVLSDETLLGLLYPEGVASSTEEVEK